MVDWTYCKKCGTVVDEFESVCSVCKERTMWYKEDNQRMTSGEVAVNGAIFILGLIGAITAIWIILDLIFVGAK